MDKSLLLNAYIPAAFWAMDSHLWQEYLDELPNEHHDVLSVYPFKWAHAWPRNPQSALDFLRDIGVDDGQTTADAIEAQYVQLPAFEELIAQGAVDWEEPRGNMVPSHGFRMVAEWEPMAGTLINWPVFYPPLWETFKQMVAAASNATVFLRIPEGYLGAGVLVWLKDQGIDMGAVRAIPGPLGDIWAKDYSPVFGVNRYTGEPVAHKLAFAAFYPAYRKGFRHIVEIDNRFSWVDGYQVYRTEIMYDGGYLCTDGDGTCIVTRRMFSDNSDIPNLFAKLEAWLGAERLVVIDEEPGDVLGHINHLKFIDSKRVLLGMPEEERHPIYRYQSNLERLLEKLGYEVIHLPCPLGATWDVPFWSPPAILYANSLIVNDRILTTKYGHGLEKYDQEAFEIYQKALPDHEVIPIDCAVLANGGGGVYCTTHSVPDVNKLRIERL